MNRSPNYKKATNLANKIFINYKNISFPLNMFQIIRLFPNIRIEKYSEMAAKSNTKFYDFIEILPSNLGFTFKYGDRSIICYNDKKHETTNRFTLAHELGHILLNHSSSSDFEEKEANCFARNLLCPVTFAKELNIETIADYMNFFGVSEPMAEACVGHIDSDLYYISIDLYNYMVLKNKLYNAYKQYSYGLY